MALKMAKFAQKTLPQWPPICPAINGCIYLSIHFHFVTSPYQPPNSLTMLHVSGLDTRGISEKNGIGNVNALLHQLCHFSPNDTIRSHFLGMA